MKIFNDRKVKNAVMLGTLCSVSYLAVYIARNILGAVTPQMVDSGEYTKEFIGSLSSLYFIFYALGQLVNGVLGDKIKARNMISFGLILAGVCNFAFPMLKSELAIEAVYAMTGFFLSMVYAPMTKVVAENTEPIHAVRCSLGYTLASFFGSPFAGVLASLMVWQSAFAVSSAALVVMGVMCFVIFIIFEKSGIVKYNYSKKKRAKGSEDPEGSDARGGAVKRLMARHIVGYTVISMVTGVTRTTVIFWLPTYLTEFLGFSPKMSASIFSFCTLFICFSTFFAVFLYEKLKRKTELTMLLTFIMSAVCFAGAYLFDIKTVNIVFIMLAIFFNNSAASILWSVYCPSLKDTGVVSTATGFLDFASYMAAAASSTAFANSVSTIGWSNLVLVWTSLMVVGLIASTVIFRKADRK